MTHDTNDTPQTDAHFVLVPNTLVHTPEHPRTHARLEKDDSHTCAAGSSKPVTASAIPPRHPAKSRYTMLQHTALCPCGALSQWSHGSIVPVISWRRTAYIIKRIQTHCRDCGKKHMKQHVSNQHIIYNSSLAIIQTLLTIMVFEWKE